MKVKIEEEENLIQHCKSASTGDKMKIDKNLNLLLDLEIPKRGPFKPFDYKEEDLDTAVNEIIKLCKEE